MHLDISLIISQILAFLLMLLILKKFAWKPLLKILNDRKTKIESEFKSIETEKKEIQKLTNLYENKLKTIEEEAKQKIAEAIFVGHKQAEAIHQEAHAEAKALILRAQNDINNEIIKAKSDLKTQLVQTIVYATQKLMREKMDPQKDEKLIRDLLNEANPDEPV